MDENSAIGQLTLYEDPVPVDFSHLTTPKKHQVGQDQHGGGTRCKGGMKSTAGLRGEELDLREKTGSVSLRGQESSAEVPPGPRQVPAQDTQPRAQARP